MYYICVRVYVCSFLRVYASYIRRRCNEQRSSVRVYMFMDRLSERPLYCTLYQRTNTQRTHVYAMSICIGYNKVGVHSNDPRTCTLVRCSLHRRRIYDAYTRRNEHAHTHKTKIRRSCLIETQQI